MIALRHGLGSYDHPSLASLVGARTSDGAYELVAPLEGTAERGRFIARGPDPATAHLVAVGGPLASSHAEVARRLELRGAAGVTPLDRVGSLEPASHPLGLVACIEQLPQGLPSHHWAAGPLPFAPVTSLGAQLAGIVAGAVAGGNAAIPWTIRPEVVYVTGSINSAAVTAVAPRCEHFWAQEAPRDSGRIPVFADVFSAPERIEGDLGPAGDTFAVAATIAYWATGEPPFPGADPAAQASASRRGRRRPWTAESRLDAIIGPALAPNPSDRPTIDDLAILFATVR